MKRRRRTFWWMIAGPAVVLATIVLGAFPYLAITETGGSKVLVVEGWMEDDALQQAAQLILDSGYTRVYTTGTVRPFAYYVQPGHGLSVELRETEQDVLEVNVSGLPGAAFVLTADGDTLLDQAVEPHGQQFRVDLPRPVADLAIVAKAMNLTPGTPAIFIRHLTIGGLNVHLLQQRAWFTRPNDLALPAWPTYAHSAQAALVRKGVPSSLITAVPAYGLPRSRTWGNAHAFGIQARNDDLAAYDVATLGVHARRSRNLFRAASGRQVHVGVVALTDPYCTKTNWWRSYRGWATLIKEVLGTPERQAVEIKRMVAPRKP